MYKRYSSFASDFLIPKAAMKQYAPNRDTSDDEIKALAALTGIHPGIVAGRLQHDQIIASNRCTKLKEKYVFEMSM